MNRRALERLETVRRHGLFSAYSSAGSFADDLKLALYLAETSIKVREALRPFADLAKWIAENRPDRDRDADEVQIEGWPYTLSVGWLRRARQIVEASGIEAPSGVETGNADSTEGESPAPNGGDAQ